MPEKKILLVNPPSRRPTLRDLYCSMTPRGGYNWAPVDLLVLSALLKERHDLAVLDAVAEGISFEAALVRAAAFRPRGIVSLVGSVTLEDDLGWLQSLKQKTSAPVLILGNISLDPDHKVLHDHPWIDGLIQDGAGPELADYFDGDPAGTREYQGLVFRRNGQIRKSPSPARQSTATLAYPPPRHDLFPLHRYRVPWMGAGKTTSMLASYGCVFSCGYCVHRRESIAPRLRPIDDVLRELDSLRDLGVKNIYFRDPIFAGTRENALALTSAMGKRNYPFSWAGSLRIETSSGELLGAMRAAGCRWVAVGIESANADVLEKYRKPLPLEQIKSFIRQCHAAGLLAAGYFILGLPGEDVRSVRETIDFAVASELDFATFTVPVPDYGTTFRKEAENTETGNGGEPFDRGNPRRGLRTTISEEEYRGLFKEAYRRMYFRPSYVFRMACRLRGVGEWRGAFAHAGRLFWDVWRGGGEVRKR
ncbi:MAG TPA: radical SAM protein [Elusimicrobiota bacterium]|nr:radical SAM protein [Elusimicrobiota bacterium]